MARDELDLDRGDRSRANADGESRRRRSNTRTEKDPETILDDEVRSQCSRAFEGIAKNRDTHEDEELATAVREEADAMTEGFVSLTTNLTFLRMPFIILLNLIITLLAFGRVGGILFSRFVERRERKMQEKQMMEQGFTYGPDGEMIPAVAE